MKRSILAASLALASATGASAPAAPPYDHGSLALHQLAHLLGGAPVSHATPATDEAHLAWFLDTALDDPDSYREAAQAYHRGQPVAIVRGTRSAATDAVLQELFSAASPAPFALYVKTAEGSPHIITTEASACSAAQCQLLVRQIGDVVRDALAAKAVAVYATIDGYQRKDMTRAQEMRSFCIWISQGSQCICSFLSADASCASFD